MYCCSLVGFLLALLATVGDLAHPGFDGVDPGCPEPSSAPTLPTFYPLDTSARTKSCPLRPPYSCGESFKVWAASLVSTGGFAATAVYIVVESLFVGGPWWSTPAI